MRLNIILILTLGMLGNSVSAQVSEEGAAKFMQGIYSDANYYREYFKDSVALYTMNITAVVENEEVYSVKISSNDSLLLSRMTRMKDYLTHFDYRSLLGNKTKAIFTLPVSITILQSKNGPMSLSADLDRKISSLFFRSKEKTDVPVIYLPAIVMSIDMKRYY